MGLVGGGVGLLVFGVIIVIGSIVASNYVSRGLQNCGEWYGEIGQILDPDVARSCNMAFQVNNASQIGLVIGGVMTVIGIVLLAVGLTWKPEKKNDVVRESVEKKNDVVRESVEKKNDVVRESVVTEVEPRDDKSVLGGAFAHWEYTGRKLFGSDKQKN